MQEQRIKYLVPTKLYNYVKEWKDANPDQIHELFGRKLINDLSIEQFKVLCCYIFNEDMTMITKKQIKHKLIDEVGASVMDIIDET